MNMFKCLFCGWRRLHKNVLLQNALKAIHQLTHAPVLSYQSGTLDKTEIGAAAATLGILMSEGSLESAFEDMDEAGTGEVLRHCFVCMHYYAAAC